MLIARSNEMNKELDAVSQAIGTLTGLGEKQIAAEESHDNRFSIVVDNADQLSRNQILGLEKLGEDFGAGRPQMIPAMEGLPPKYEFSGPISDLKPDEASAKLQRSSEIGKENSIARNRSEMKGSAAVPEDRNGVGRRKRINFRDSQNRDTPWDRHAKAKARAERPEGTNRKDAPVKVKKKKAPQIGKGFF